MVTYFKEQVSEMVGDGVDLLFCNEQEAMTWTGEDSIEGALTALSNTATQWVCTRGKDGASVFDGKHRFDVPGRSVTPVDTNGAGDMFAGAFLYGLSSGWGFEKSARFGVHASGYLITQYGPRLRLASHAVLLEEFEATQ
jgi:sugar/nucleoside kinase (ribokinase family)